MLTDDDGVTYELLQCLGHGRVGEIWKVQERTQEGRKGPIYALK